MKIRVVALMTFFDSLGILASLVLGKIMLSQPHNIDFLWDGQTAAPSGMSDRTCCRP